MLAPLRALSLSIAATAAALAAAAPALAQSDEEPLARFEDAVCPGVVGLKLEAAQDMVGRIRARAAEFGRSLAPDGSCEANLVVAFVDDGLAFARRMQRDNGWMFAELSPADREMALNDTGPARAVLRVRARSRDGMPIPRRENMIDLPQTEQWMAHSKIYTATRNDILYSLILIDRDAISGMTIAQLADYAAYRSLTRTLPQTPDTRADSILALFDGGAQLPAGLTEFDRVYLSELYDGVPNMPAPARLAQLEAATGRNIFVE
jgi:alkanesulfonate monooxygenase SsuD/methylene tetrahydromethanopterin reductase-like flavin-dependent oxidoreductase (luciferase family)